ncbi:MAG: SDR family NAD(P)-dependent oxidoreductase [Alkalispirochaeta sp.]
MKRSTEPQGTVVLTGASSGLGRALAHRLGETGCTVAVVARRQEALAELSAAIGSNVVPVPLDLSEPQVAERLEAALAAVGIMPEAVELLINNAALGSFGHFVETDPDRLTMMQRMNVQVPMELSRWIAPYMVRRGSGTIANVASVAAFSPGPLMSEYYADKAWMLAFTQSLDAELRPRGVRVCTVCPGPFESGFHTGAGMDRSRLGTLPSAASVAGRALRAILRGRTVAPIGVGAWVWAVVGPRLPWRLSRSIMYRLQRRRLKGSGAGESPAQSP